ncbi:MAG: hypothetical protein RBR45_14325 [Pseudomonas sp.]|nr:hypothetical protein [Pseudomonas sp.]
MMIEFSALISGLGTSLEIAKTFSTLKGENERAIAVAELTRSIADAQAQLLATMNECFKLTAENQSLKKQLEKDQRFDRYYMQKIEYSGDVIFTLKDDFVSLEEPAHDICPHCKEQGRVSYLMKSRSQYVCKVQGCGFKTYHAAAKQMSYRMINY